MLFVPFSNQNQGPEEAGGHPGVKTICWLTTASTTMRQHFGNSVAQYSGFPRYQGLVVIKKILYWCVSLFWIID